METDRILDNARFIKINNPVAMTTLGKQMGMKTVVDESMLSNIAFASPDDIQFMLDFFGLSPQDALSNEITDKLKFIHGMADGDSIGKYLSHLNSVIGGRYNHNYIDKVFIYLSLDKQEQDFKVAAKEAARDKKQFLRED